MANRYIEDQALTLKVKEGLVKAQTKTVKEL